MGHRPVRGRCAALAARVGVRLRAAERRDLRVPQDLVRRPVRASPSSWALSTPSLRAAHGSVRLVRVGCRGDERVRDPRAIGRQCRAAHFLGACALMFRDPVRLCE